MSPTRVLCCPAFVATLCDCRASGIHQNRGFLVSHACSMAPSVCYVPFVRSQGPLGSIRIASSLSPTRLLRPLGFVSSTSAARVFLCPVFVATPRICEFHSCCARVIVPSVCCDPSNLRVPHLLRASYCAQCLLRPLGLASSTSAARVALCPVFVATLSPLQGLWDPQNRKFHILHVCR